MSTGSNSKIKTYIYAWKVLFRLTGAAAEIGQFIYTIAVVGCRLSTTGDNDDDGLIAILIYVGFNGLQFEY